MRTAISTFSVSSPTRIRMKVRLRGMNGCFGAGGAPRPSAAGSTRKPEGCGVVGGFVEEEAFSAV